MLLAASVMAWEWPGVPRGMTFMYWWMAGRRRLTFPMSEDPVPPRSTGTSTSSPSSARYRATRSAMAWLFLRSA